MLEDEKRKPPVHANVSVEGYSSEDPRGSIAEQKSCEKRQLRL